MPISLTNALIPHIQEPRPQLLVSLLKATRTSDWRILLRGHMAPCSAVSATAKLQL